VAHSQKQEITECNGGNKLSKPKAVGERKAVGANYLLTTMAATATTTTTTTTPYLK